MAKGRQFNPSTKKDGIWFGHKGADNSDAGTLPTELTTTGETLAAPYRAKDRPAPPPQLFTTRFQTDYRTYNPFSVRDNRNTLQACGEYFGDGRNTRFLGRKLRYPLHLRFHHTEPDYLMHHCRAPTLYSYTSEVSANYVDNSGIAASTASGRRFHRQRPEPQAGPSRAISTNTTDWCPTQTPRSFWSVKASNQVLAQSQRPYLKGNTWKYSYRGLPRVYPPYKISRRSGIVSPPQIVLPMCSSVQCFKSK